MIPEITYRIDANGDRVLDLSNLAPAGTPCSRCGGVPAQVTAPGVSWHRRPNLEWCDTHGWVCTECLMFEQHGVSCFVD